MALTDRLLAYYDFEQNFDQEFPAHNLVPPNGNPLTAPAGQLGMARSVSGKINKGIYFDSAPATLWGADAPLFRITGDKTFAFWLKLSPSEAIRYRPLFKESEYGFEINPTTMLVSVLSGSGFFAHTKVLQFDTWYLLILWFDVSTDTAYLRINNEVEQSGIIGPWPPIASAMELVRESQGATIDELGIWDRILTNAEMLELYNHGAGLTYEDITGEAEAASIECPGITCCEDNPYAYVSNTGEGKDYNSACNPAATVEFEPPSGTRLIMPSLVILRTNRDDAVIRYTTDNSDPTDISTEYTTPITIDSPGTVIKARAFVEGCPDGPIAAASYTQNQNAAGFTYVCTTVDRAGIWGIFAADGSPDEPFVLKVVFPSITGVVRFDVQKVDNQGVFNGEMWSTKEFHYPYADEPSKQYRAMPLVIYIGGVQQNIAYQDDYSAAYGDFAAATHTLELQGQAHFHPANTYFKFTMVLADGTSLTTIVDTSCEAVPGPLCPAPGIPTVAAACGPYRIDVTFALTVGTLFKVFRATAFGGPYTEITNGAVATNPQTYQDTAITPGVTYYYYISNIPSLCVDYKNSPVASAMAIRDPIVSLSASPSTINLGDSATLHWSSFFVSGNVTIDQGIGAKPGNAPGSQVVSPVVTTTYTITGVNVCGTTVQAQATVTVIQPATCGLVQPSFVTIDGYTDAMFSAGLCGGLRVGGTVPWNGQFEIREGCYFRPLEISMSFRVNRELNTTPSAPPGNPGVDSRIEMFGGVWTMSVFGWVGTTPTNVWTGTKLTGDTPVGTYTQVSGCASGPATVDIV